MLNNNLLGNAKFCPLVRKTEALVDSENTLYLVLAHISQYSPEVVERSIEYLYIKETRASSLLEKEDLDDPSLIAFLITLRQTLGNGPSLLSKHILLDMHKVIKRDHCEEDYRSEQNTIESILQAIKFIPPKSEDISDLMAGLIQCANQLLGSEVPTIISAAIISFGFVFLHPFLDGNGIHRWLLHFMLKHRLGEKMIPLSVSIHKNPKPYKDVLEKCSAQLMWKIEYHRAGTGGTISVTNETPVLYKFLDATPFCEFLVTEISNCLHMVPEFEFLNRYDQSEKAIKEFDAHLTDAAYRIFIHRIPQLGKNWAQDLPPVLNHDVGILGKEKMDAIFRVVCAIWN